MYIPGGCGCLPEQEREAEQADSSREQRCGREFLLACSQGFYSSFQGVVAQSVDQFNFVGAVPVNVVGLELETFYLLTDSWDMGFLVSWSEGENDNGTVPCNDYGTDSPSVGDIAAATGDHL